MGYFKYIDYRKTPCQKVKKLLPGHFLHFSERVQRLTDTGTPEKIRIDRTLTHDRMLADLKSLLRDAVKIRCDNRFRAGAHVSSGLDSGIVSALARKEYLNRIPFTGFHGRRMTILPGNVKFDERELVVSSAHKQISGRFFPTWSRLIFTDRFIIL